MRRGKASEENVHEMRRLLDDYRQLLDEMLFKTRWHHAADEDEIITLVLETQLLAQDFKNALTLLHEERYGTDE